MKSPPLPFTEKDPVITGAVWTQGHAKTAIVLAKFQPIVFP